MWKDFFEAAIKKNVPEQIAGSKDHKEKKPGLTSGEMVEGQAVSLSEQTEKVAQVTEFHREHVRSIEATGTKAERTENMVASEQIEMLQKLGR